MCDCIVRAYAEGAAAAESTAAVTAREQMLMNRLSDMTKRIGVSTVDTLPQLA